MAALHQGRPTLILTRDGDLLDQFHKLWALLTHHYQSLLFAEMYDAMPDMFVARSIPWGRGNLDKYFVSGEGFLVRKPVGDSAQFSRFVLPLRFTEVPVVCLLFGGLPPRMKLQALEFIAEKDMARVIRQKGATLGRAAALGRTDCLNCHVTGLPTGIDCSRDWIAFPRDRVKVFSNSPLKYPLLDIASAVNHCEDIRKGYDECAKRYTLRG